MKIEYGTWRMVFLIGWLAIKAPRVRMGQLMFVLRPVVRLKLSLTWSGLRLVFITPMRMAIRANWDEFLTWAAVREPFLEKTYFSIGIINVMRRSRGKKITREEAHELYDALGEAVDGSLDHHHFCHWRNYRKEGKGYVLIDYGNERDDTPPHRQLIARHKKQFKEVLGW